MSDAGTDETLDKETLDTADETLDKVLQEPMVDADTQADKPVEERQSMTRGRSPRQRVAAWVTTVAATAWLAVSAVVGVGMVSPDSQGSVPLSDYMVTISSRSQHQAYGGDAYTGIQNAASDTEHAVVEASNANIKALEAIGRTIAVRQAAASDAITLAIGWLLISTGVSTFLVVFSLNSRTLFSKRSWTAPK